MIRIIATIIFLSPALAFAGEFASDEYTMSGGIGAYEGTTTASENYSLTPRLGDARTHGDGNSADVPKPRTGSRVTRIENIVDTTFLPEVIVATQRESRIASSYGGGDVRGVPDMKGGTVDGVDETTDSVITPVNMVPKESEKIKNVASLIEALASGNLTDVFQGRSARVVVLVCVLLFLAYLRNYTSVGKRLRPF